MFHMAIIFINQRNGILPQLLKTQHELFLGNLIIYVDFVKSLQCHRICEKYYDEGHNIEPLIGRN